MNHPSFDHPSLAQTQSSTSSSLSFLSFLSSFSLVSLCLTFHIRPQDGNYGAMDTSHAAAKSGILIVGPYSRNIQPFITGDSSGPWRIRVNVATLEYSFSLVDQSTNSGQAVLAERYLAYLRPGTGSSSNGVCGGQYHVVCSAKFSVPKVCDVGPYNRVYWCLWLVCFCHRITFIDAVCLCKLAVRSCVMQTLDRTTPISRHPSPTFRLFSY